MHKPKNLKKPSTDVLRLSKLSFAVMVALGGSAYAGPGKVFHDGLGHSAHSASGPCTHDAATGQVVPSNSTALCTTLADTYYANSPILRKFVDTLPQIPGLNSLLPSSLGGGQYIPIATGDTTSYPGSQYFELAVVEYSQPMHSDLTDNTGLHATKLRGYVQVDRAATQARYQAQHASTPSTPTLTGTQTTWTYPDGSTIMIPLEKGNGDHSLVLGLDGKPVLAEAVFVDKPHYLGPAIVATKGIPTRVKFNNLLPQGIYGDMFLPVDESLPGVNQSTTNKFPQTRVAIHLHGGDSPWISDGTPNQWFSAETDPTMDPTLKRGDRAFNVPDMPFPGENAQTLYWPNEQSGRLMWYHDHAFGLTRQNAYAGMAAPYLVIDPNEEAAIAPAIPSEMIPLVIQDKTFVPSDIDVQDAGWNHLLDTTTNPPSPTTTLREGRVADQQGKKKPLWGSAGDLWFPHVYEPAVLNDLSLNPAARWDYAPTLGTGYLNPLLNLPDVSTTPEAYNDTSMVNGVAYPKLDVKPKAYRFRILNGANDRYFNLSLWVADPATNTVVNAANYPNGPVAQNTEVKMLVNPIQSIAVNNVGSGYNAATTTVTITDSDPNVNVTPAIATPVFGANGEITSINVTYPGAGYVNPVVTITDTAGGAGATALATVDARIGGIPDPGFDLDPATGKPKYVGPAIIQFGNESGLMPKSVKFDPQPINLNSAGEVINGGFYLGNAERGDVVIDFSQYAGKTLILYNDSTAPVPGGDPNYDYFTDPNNDRRPFGGAAPTLPGYGPNTRTIMQINVAADLPAAPFDQASQNALDGILGGLHATVADPMLFNTKADGALNGSFSNGVLTGTNDKAGNPLSINPADIRVKIIEGLNDVNFGRLIANFDYEDPAVVGAKPLPLAYIDKPTDIVADGEQQIWHIKNIDADNHPIHFHLFNVQVLGRIDPVTGDFFNPLPNEAGWKEVVQNWPGQELLVALKPKTPSLPFGLPSSVRLMDPTMTPGAINNESIQYNGIGDSDIPLSFVQFNINPTTGKLEIPVAPAANESVVRIGGAFYKLKITDSGSGYAYSADPANPAPLVAVSIRSNNVELAAGNAVVDANGVITSINLTSVSEHMHPISNAISVIIDPPPAPVDPAVTVTTATATLTPVAASSLDYKGNEFVDYSWEYVFHCHILGHEENDLMRPVVFKPVIAAPVAASAVTVDQAAGTVSWADATPVAPAQGTNFIPSITKGNAGNEIGFRVEYAVMYNGTPVAWNAAKTTDASIDASINPDVFVKIPDKASLNPDVKGKINALANSQLFNTDVAATLLANANENIAYRVMSVNQIGEAEAVSAELVQSPKTPTLNTAALSSSGAVSLSWSDLGNETGYELYRAEVASGNNVIGGYALVNTISANSTSYMDAAIVAGKDYAYKLVAKNTVGSSADSNVLTVAQAPTAPVLSSTISVSGTIATLNWTDASNNESGFRVERRQVGTASFTALQTVAIGTTAYDDTTVAANTDYEYQVVALNGDTLSSTSNQVTLSQLPAAPSAVSASLASTVAAANATVNLSWTDNASNETGYSVQYSADNINWTSATPSAITSSSATLAVPAGASYWFKVIVNKTGLTDAAGFTPIAATTATALWTPSYLLAPTINSATSAVVNGATTATVTWTNTSTGQTGYSIERCSGTTATCTATAGNWIAIGTSTSLPATATSFTDTTLATGSNYLYRIKALGKDANTVATAGAATLSAQVTGAVLVNAPSALTAAAVTTGVKLTWTDNSTNETAFQVERWDNTNATVAVVGTVARTASLGTATGASATFTDTTVVPGPQYTYQVRAVKTVAATATVPASTSLSTPSNTVTYQVSIAAPSALTATQSGSSAALSWVDNSVNETAFEIWRSDNTAAPLATVTRAATQVAAVGSAVTYTDATTVAGNSYTYTVRAVYAPTAVAPAVAPAPSYSSFTAATTIAISVPAPTALSTALPAAPGVGVLLNWTDNATMETHFEVQRSLISVDSTGAKTATLAANYVALPMVTTTGRTTTGAVAYSDTTATSAAMQAALTSAGLTATINSTGTAATLASGESVVWSYQVRAAVVSATAGVATVYSKVSNEAHTQAAVASVGAPSQLVATPNAANTSLTLSWIDNSTTETSFTVTRTDSAGVITNLPTVTRSTTNAKATGGKVTATADATAIPGMAYTYAVTAVTPTGNIGPTKVNAQLPLLAPSSASISLVTTGIQVGWTDASNNEIGFRIVRNTVATSPTGLPVDSLGNVTADPTQFVLSSPVAFNVSSSGTQKTATAAARTYIDTTAVAGTAYLYTVAAVGGTGTATTTTVAASTVTSAAVGTTPVYISKPVAAPSIPSAVATNATTITVTWSDLSSNETGFQVERAPVTYTNGVASVGSYAVLATTTRTATQTTGLNTAVSYADATAVAGSSYVYRVTAVNQTGTVTNAMSSAVVSNVVDFIAPATAPTLVSAAASPTLGAVDLVWADTTTTETGFTVQQASNATFTTGLKSTVVNGGISGTGSNVSYTLATGLATGKTVYVRVLATNAIGSSAASAASAAIVVK